MHQCPEFLRPVALHEGPFKQRKQHAANGDDGLKPQAVNLRHKVAALCHCARQMLVEVHAGGNVSGCGGQTLSQTGQAVSFFLGGKGRTTKQQSNKVTKVKSGKRKCETGIRNFGRKRARKAQNKIGNGRHDTRDLKFERAYACCYGWHFPLFAFQISLCHFKLEACQPCRGCLMSKPEKQT